MGEKFHLLLAEKCPLCSFSIIAQVITEKRAHWLVENYVISCYNHPMQGDYNTEALIFKMATARFWCFWRKEIRKCICSDNQLSNYTKTIILHRLSEYCGHNIHFAFGEISLPYFLNTFLWSSSYRFVANHLHPYPSKQCWRKRVWLHQKGVSELWGELGMTCKCLNNFAPGCNSSCDNEA